MEAEAGAAEIQNGPAQVIEADLEYKLKREEFYKKVDDEDFFWLPIIFKFKINLNDII